MCARVGGSCSSQREPRHRKLLHSEPCGSSLICGKASLDNDVIEAACIRHLEE
jgi:hypothetical protein